MNINSKIEIIIKNGNKLVVKKYCQEDIIKFKRESYFYKFSNEKKIAQVPEIDKITVLKRELIIRFVESNKQIEDKEITLSNLKNFSNFINLINKFESTNYSHKAGESVFSINEIYLNIYKRLKFLEINGTDQEFYSKIKLAIEKCEYKDNLVFSKLISPSDFGLHNTIKTKEKLYFIDFEYAGIDSEEKLIYDFVLHPKNKIKESNHKEMINLFFSDINSFNNFNKNIYKLFLIWWILRLASSLCQKVMLKRIQLGTLNAENLNYYVDERKSNINHFFEIYERNR